MARPVTSGPEPCTKSASVAINRQPAAVSLPPPIFTVVFTWYAKALATSPAGYSRSMPKGRLMSSPWMNDSTRRVASAAGGVDVERQDRTELGQRQPGFSLPLPCHPDGIVSIEIEPGGNHAAHKTKASGPRRIDEVRQHIVDVPPGAQRRRLPLLRFQHLQILEQCTSFAVHHWPYGSWRQSGHAATQPAGSDDSQAPRPAPGSRTLEQEGHSGRHRRMKTGKSTPCAPAI